MCVCVGMVLFDNRKRDCAGLISPPAMCRNYFNCRQCLPTTLKRAGGCIIAQHATVKHFQKGTAGLVCKIALLMVWNPEMCVEFFFHDLESLNSSPVY